MNTRNKAFSIVELLTVITIISLLLGLTIPALHTARIRMKVAAEKSNLRTIEFALERFADELGFYPPSAPRPALREMKNPMDPVMNTPDQGAHILYESLMGLDNLGYQKDHFYMVDNMGKTWALGPTGRLEPAKRYEHNIQSESIGIRRMNDAAAPPPDPDVRYQFGARGWGGLWDNYNPVFVDGFDIEQPRPILYYRANKNRDLLRDSNLPGVPPEPIYEYIDNELITRYSPAFDPGFSNNGENLNPREYFFKYIHDPTTGNGAYTHVAARPYKKDSFILIGAGPDGIYGPNPRENYRIDDIFNFERR